MDIIEFVEVDILKEIMSGIPAHIPEEVDWPKLMREMQSQSVLSLGYSWVDKHKDILDKSLLRNWKLFMCSQAQRWYFMLEEQDKILKLLTAHGYAVAVLKGYANAYLYPNPEVRFSNDIDLLVLWEDYKKVYNLLLGNGYQLCGELIESKHHFEVSKNGVSFEIHKRPGGTRLEGERGGKRIIRFFQDSMMHLDEVELCGYKIPMLPQRENGLMLLLHTAEHLHGGLGIRHLLDWMVYADHYLTDSYWEEPFREVTRIPEMERLAIILTRTCQLYLGLREDITWCKDTDDQTCRELMEYLVMEGDFGHKIGDIDREVRFAADVRGNRGFLRVFHTSSLYSLPIARNKKWLWPVAWLYQAFRYVIKVIFRKKPIDSLVNNQKEGAKRKRFFDRLGI